ncbi:MULTISPECIES: type II toxin-antitoxin system PemK/MazF family toxin [unclassified Microcoleus]|uniref:type II toxin-antitoxin system PemK/MazF family toxin n=1 Tax=unclassified Microcoleus TaxID=2642155 RepID=UPI002FD4EB5F
MDSNSTGKTYPRQGEIYLSRALRQLGDTKKRPVVVVPPDIRNEFTDSVIVVPFTSNLAGLENPTRVLIPAGEGGLQADSLAVCENVSALRQTFLEQGPYGQLSADVLARIQRAVQVSIGIYEL